METIPRLRAHWLTNPWSSSWVNGQLDDLISIIDILMIAIALVEPVSDFKQGTLKELSILRVEISNGKGTFPIDVHRKSKVLDFESRYNADVALLRRRSSITRGDFLIYLSVAWEIFEFTFPDASRFFDERHDVKIAIDKYFAPADVQHLKPSEISIYEHLKRSLPENIVLGVKSPEKLLQRAGRLFFPYRIRQEPRYNALVPGLGPIVLTNRVLPLSDDTVTVGTLHGTSSAYPVPRDSSSGASQYDPKTSLPSPEETQSHTYISTDVVTSTYPKSILKSPSSSQGQYMTGQHSSQPNQYFHQYQQDAIRQNRPAATQVETGRPTPGDLISSVGRNTAQTSQSTQQSSAYNSFSGQSQLNYDYPPPYQRQYPYNQPQTAGVSTSPQVIGQGYYSSSQYAPQQPGSYDTRRDHRRAPNTYNAPMLSPDQSRMNAYHTYQALPTQYASSSTVPAVFYPSTNSSIQPVYHPASTNTSFGHAQAPVLFHGGGPVHPGQRQSLPGGPDRESRIESIYDAYYDGFNDNVSRSK